MPSCGLLATSYFKRKDWRVMDNEMLIFRVTVGCNRSFTEMIQGKYDRVNSDITQERFPIQGDRKIKKELVLFHFNRVIPLDNAITEMEEKGCYPGQPEDLFALGADYPELQKQFPIIALGDRSVWRHPDGTRAFLCLHYSGDARHLTLYLFAHAWAENSRFLGVRTLPGL